MKTKLSEGGINGSRGAVSVDRAVMELRRRRAIAIQGDGRTLVVAALESVTEPLLGQLLAAGGQAFLLLTAERAQATGLNGSVVAPVAVAVQKPGDLQALRAYAGLADGRGAGLDVATWTGSGPLAAAGFALAKAGRLLPALIAFEVQRFDDVSVATVSLEAINDHADRAHLRLDRVADTRLPLLDAENATISLFRDEHTDAEHLAIVIGDLDPREPVPVRMHSSCLTGDVLGSLRCDCGEQLKTAVQRIAGLGAGVLLYLDQEGRGIGLANKLRAYSIQDSGLDTLDADRHLGFSADERSYEVAASMLRSLGISSVEIMTNNPEKIAALREHGIHVAGRLPLVGSTNAHNEKYLRAKREKAGHLVDEAGARDSAQNA
jgi:GTP cyclohydrolase II